MTHTLTVTLTNIPDEVWSGFWEHCIRIGIQECGIEIEETHDIKIDSELFLLYPDEYAEFWGSAQVVHMLSTADKKLNS